MRCLIDIQVLINFLYCEIYILITYCGEIRLNEIELEELVKKFTTKLNKSPPDFDLFLTEQGIKFQADIFDLMGFISVGNLIPALPSIMSTTLDGIKNRLDVDLDYDVLIIPKKPDSIIPKQKLKMEDVFDDFTKSMELSKEVTSLISNSINRLNSYYFLALFAYMDHYVDSIHKEILAKYRAKQCIELFDSFRTKGRPRFILESIRTKLDLGEVGKITMLPEGKSWHDSYIKMLELRHEFAHRKPIARREMLDNNLKRISKDAAKEVKTIFRNNLIDPNSANELLSEIQNILRPNFETLLILVQIGKECSGYLALYDHLIDEFFTKNKPI